MLGGRTGIFAISLKLTSNFFNFTNCFKFGNCENSFNRIFNSTKFVVKLLGICCRQFLERSKFSNLSKYCKNFGGYEIPWPLSFNCLRLVNLEICYLLDEFNEKKYTVSICSGLSFVFFSLEISSRYSILSGDLSASCNNSAGVVLVICQIRGRVPTSNENQQ